MLHRTTTSDQPQISTRFATLFAGREDAHGTHREPTLDDNGVKWNIKSTADTLRKRVTVALWKKHLAGEYPLGIIPICEGDICHFGSIDIDDYEVDTLAVVAKIEGASLPLVPCRSKSGGMHLFLFADGVPAGEMQTVLKFMATALGFGKSEIFPKQSKYPEKEFGSWMIMPYFGGTFDGKLRLQHGIKKTGGEMTVSEFLGVAEKARLTKEAFAKLATKKAKAAAPDAAFGDGPPCLQQLIPVKEHRNNALFQMAVYYRKKYPDGDKWKSHLIAANQLYISPPLPDIEVDSMTQSSDKKEDGYQYKCKDEPMCGACNKTLCLTRSFGVGGGRRIPEITSMKKVVSDETEWHLTLADGNVKIEGTKNLNHYPTFNTQCIEQINVSYHILKADEWSNILNAALTAMQPVIEIPIRFRKEGTFRDLLEVLLTDRNSGNTREVVLSDRVFDNDEENRYEFQLKDLVKHLKREGMNDVTPVQCRKWLENIGAKEWSTTIKKKPVRLWLVERDAFEKMPVLSTPEDDPKGKEI